MVKHSNKSSSSSNSNTRSNSYTKSSNSNKNSNSNNLNHFFDSTSPMSPQAAGGDHKKMIQASNSVADDSLFGNFIKDRMSAKLEGQHFSQPPTTAVTATATVTAATAVTTTTTTPGPPPPVAATPSPARPTSSKQHRRGSTGRGSSSSHSSSNHKQTPEKDIIYQHPDMHAAMARSPRSPHSAGHGSRRKLRSYHANNNNISSPRSPGIPRSPPGRKKKTTATSASSPSSSNSNSNHRIKMSPSPSSKPKLLSPRSVKARPKLPFGSNSNSNHDTAAAVADNAVKAKTAADHSQNNTPHTATPSSPAASVRRQPLAGFRGGKKWSIMEDTPAGHAEKLSLVVAVEFDDDSDDDESYHQHQHQHQNQQLQYHSANHVPKKDSSNNLHDDNDNDSYDDPPSLEEDSDIDDHHDHNGDDSESMIHHDQQRTMSRRLSLSLPADPVEVPAVGHAKATRRNSNQDRFDPSFVNNDMWTTDDDMTADTSRNENDNQKKNANMKGSNGHSNNTANNNRNGSTNNSNSRTNSSNSKNYNARSIRTISGDVSLLTESDFATHSLRRTLTPQDLESDEPLADQRSAERNKTPVTMRRSGGRQNVDDLAANFTIDIDEGVHNDHIQEEMKGEEAPLRDCVPLAKEKRKNSKRPSSPHKARLRSPKSQNKKTVAGGQPSSAASASNHRQQQQQQRREGGGGGRMKQRKNSDRNGRQGQQPVDNVPCTPVREISMLGPNHRSPLSSSLTSTPNSQSIISGKPQSTRSALQQQRQQQYQHHAYRQQTELVEEYDDSSEDGHTLGASTITTNFTQRTRGDNTVSTRSLFSPSEFLRSSETPQIPQRKRDIDHASNHQQMSMAELRQHSAGMHDNNRGAFRRSANDVKDPGLRMVLRKKSSDADELLEKMVAHYSASNSDESAASSQLQRHIEGPEIAANYSELKVESSKPYLQLNMHPDGVRVDTVVSNNLKLDELVSLEGSAANNMFGSGAFQSTSTKVEPSIMRHEGGAEAEQDSIPESVGSRKKRKNRLHLFKKAMSWKGAIAAVPLEDEE